MKPRLYIEQKITAFANKYIVYGATESGKHDSIVAIAQQKRFAFKEKVTFYTDETKSSVSFTFRAEKVLDVHGNYIVEAADGSRIGMFKKQFKKSLLSSTWIVMDADEKELFQVTESSTALAFFRRYGGWIPVVGGVIEIITAFLRYHFVFTDAGAESVVGTYKKTTLFRDHYMLSMTDEAAERCDWRVLASMGVGLDALQSR